jgi:hypothetical protein
MYNIQIGPNVKDIFIAPELEKWPLFLNRDRVSIIYESKPWRY